MFQQERLPEVIILMLGKCLAKTVRNKTIYAMMQPHPELPPPASMGIEGVGSCSGELEVMVKSEA